MKVFYFTTTGNNLFVAKKLGGELYSIPQVLKDKNLNFEDEKIGIVFPCYYLGIPNIVVEFIEKVKLKANYIFAIMTYGNMSGNGIYQFTKLAKKNNVKINYANDILMVDNYLPMFDMKKQKIKKDNSVIENNINSIAKDIVNERNYILKKNFINAALSNVSQIYYKKQTGNFSKKFHINEDCNSCKICEKVCAFKNIQVDKKPEFKNNCEQCMACIQHCPKNAIHLKSEKNNERFINPNIKLKEIIQSNKI